MEKWNLIVGGWGGVILTNRIRAGGCKKKNGARPSLLEFRTAPAWKIEFRLKHGHMAGGCGLPPFKKKGGCDIMSSVLNRNDIDQKDFSEALPAIADKVLFLVNGRVSRGAGHRSE